MTANDVGEPPPAETIESVVRRRHLGPVNLDGRVYMAEEIRPEGPNVAWPYTELIGAFKKRAGGNILQPMVDGQPGNPVLIDDKARALVLASEAGAGCRHLMDRQPERVYAYASANRRFVTDLDTEQDLRAMTERTGWKLELPEAAAA